MAGAAADSSLRACLSRTSSGISMRRALGGGLSLSRHNRLEKAVLSAVSPCLTMARVLPSGRAMAASMGDALYSEAKGMGEVGDGGCQR